MEGFEVENILKELPPTPPKKDIELIMHAYNFALKAHQGQTRFSGEPYFIHVFETAKNLARYGMDAETVAAGFLHDTIEDTEVTDKELEKEFGKEITNLVKGVTKLGHVKFRGETRHVESLRKFLMALAQDYRVLMIKLADRLHNLKTLDHVRKDKQRRIALESIEVYAPLADRLGIGKLKGEIEDAAFAYAYPKEEDMVKKILSERSEKAKKALGNVYTELERELKKSSIKVIKIDFRIKHLFSLWKKLEKYDMNIDKLYDVVALRVVVKSVEECYGVLGLIHSLWKPLPARIKDYIALPKINGYQSLHTTIFTGDGELVEIQIRTEEMHGRAEFGIASHYTYKNDAKKHKRDQKFQWISEFKNLGETVAEPADFLKHLKSDFFSDRIFAFTPDGDVIDLPKESTPIDFAYTIHSAIGDKASGAKINGKLMQLDAVIHSGDIVEIITRKDGKPKRRWLDFVRTTIAKKHLKTFLNKNKGAEIVKLRQSKKNR
jgi:GTP diphosphokinase / guanosine-3',5'-bis(diphosphate) 3'-diphosphatase